MQVKITILAKNLQQGSRDLSSRLESFLLDNSFGHQKRVQIWVIFKSDEFFWLIG